MSQENVEVVRSYLELIQRRDLAAALALLDPEVDYEVGQELPMRGHAAVRAMWERWDADWEDYELLPEEFIDAGDQVLVTVRCSARGRGSGVVVDTRTFDVYTLRDRKCAQGRIQTALRGPRSRGTVGVAA
jgi:ketosteroid isomerase-like protein